MAISSHLRKALSDRKFKHGGSAALLTVLVVAVIIVFNLVITQLNWRYDLTENRLFSLSDQTLAILDSLEEDVVIYGLYRTGRENVVVSELVAKYAARSPHVRLEYRDPMLEPQFVQEYEDGDQVPELGSVIVQSGNRYRVLYPRDFISYTYDQHRQPQPQGLAIEQRITSAIQYVSDPDTPVLYRLVGHEEMSLNDDIRTLLQRENWEIRDLDLLTEEAVPEDAAVLLIASPKRDMTAEEEDRIHDYLRQGGRAIVLMDYRQTEMPNFASLLATYGLRIHREIVVEGDANRRLANPMYLVPEMQDHAALDPLIRDRSSAIIPVAQPIEILSTRRDTIEFEPLLTTSTNSWSKAQTEPETLEREAEDRRGPFTVGMLVADRPGPDFSLPPARMIVLSTAGVLSSQFASLSRQANYDMLINSVNWMHDRAETLYIRPRSLSVEGLRMQYGEQMLLSGLAVVVVPAFIFLTGFIIWARRRNL